MKTLDIKRHDLGIEGHVITETRFKDGRSKIACECGRWSVANFGQDCTKPLIKSHHMSVLDKGETPEGYDAPVSFRAVKFAGVVVPV